VRLPNVARTDRRVVVVLVLLGSLLLAYGAMVLYSGSTVPKGTTVSGMDIGGLSRAAAIAKLDRAFGEGSGSGLRLRAGERTATLNADRAGVRIDAAATVSKALSGRFTPPVLLDGLFGGREIRPDVRVDEARLAAALTAVNRQIGGKPATEGAVVFRGLTPVAIWPREGSGLDVRTVASKIRAEYPTEREIAAPIERLRPRATEAAVRQTLTGPARTAVTAPVTLASGSASGNAEIAVSPAVLARYLRFQPDRSGRLQPRIDGVALAGALGRRLHPLERQPRDATFVVKNGTPRMVPSRDGRKVDGQGLATAMEGAVMQPGERAVTVPLKTAAPRITTEQVSRLGIKEKISTFTTQYPCCAPRVKNIQTIADILDGYVVKPGETFSLNGVVGRREKARGFVEAPMILNGRFVNDVGGGVSQFATTMFNAVFFGGLQDVQHTPHSFYISRYPAGRESTVSYPQPDFRWRNDSPYGVLVDTSYTGTSVTVTFWSTKRYEIESKSSARYAVTPFPSQTGSGPDCIPMPGAEGFQIDVWRIFKQEGRTVRTQKFHTTYLPEPRLTCKG
jgi:vancomycin resistance protein YoaR